MTSKRSPFLTILVGTTALLCVAASAYASGDQSGDLVVAACASPNGQLRLVESASQCRPSERPLQWSVRGPQGPVGPQGPQGEQGPQGLQGAQGPAGPGFSGPQFYTIGNGDLQGAGPGSVIQTFATPASGTYVLTGAGRLFAGVHLPQGAVASEVRMGGIDASATVDLRFDLVEQDVATGASAVLASLTSTGSPGNFVLASAVSPIVIDNATKHYFVHVQSVNPASQTLVPWPQQTLQVLGLTIGYSLE